MNTGPFDILLVEDNPADADLFQEAAAECGLPVRVSVAEDGDRALAALAARAPHLVVLDLNLPRRTGREVLAVVKADPALRALPVLVLSTSSAEQDVTACYASHANAYIVKPADYTHYRRLLAAIAQFWFAVATLPSEIAHA